jgi:2-methylisocitrate lyase-like PEP mutase family enzyme
VCASVSRPVNALAGLRGVGFTVRELEALGVRRISVGSLLHRAAWGALLRAAREMADAGTFTFADEALTFADASRLAGGA